MEWMERVRQTPGKVGVYYRPLDGEAVGFNEDLPLIAASVIKLPVMVEAFRRIEAGELDPDERVTVPPEAKLPSCGALTYLHDGLTVTVMDLITLMIILSDNTATNLLIDRLGMEMVNRTMAELGIPGIALRRKLFDAEQSRRGVENTVTARGIGLLLTRMATGKLLGAQTDEQMLYILKNQRLNGKLPFFLHGRGVKIAHKTGEDDGITHDVGVVYAPKPFVVCMLSNEVDVPAFERLMQDAALEMFLANQ
ncbi:MAG: serine hydrolase [Butyricicoccus sp.]